MLPLTRWFFMINLTFIIVCCGGESHKESENHTPVQELPNTPGQVASNQTQETTLQPANPTVEKEQPQLPTPTSTPGFKNPVTIQDLSQFNTRIAIIEAQTQEASKHKFTDFDIQDSYASTLNFITAAIPNFKSFSSGLAKHKDEMSFEAYRMAFENTLKVNKSDAEFLGEFATFETGHEALVTISPLMADAIGKMLEQVQTYKKK